MTASLRVAAVTKDDVAHVTPEVVAIGAQSLRALQYRTSSDSDAELASEPTSPELVLVDPELASRARAALTTTPYFAKRAVLRDAGERELVPALAGSAPRTEATEPALQRDDARRTWMRRSFAVAAAVAGLAAVIVGDVGELRRSSGPTDHEVSPARVSRAADSANAPQRASSADGRRGTRVAGIAGRRSGNRNRAAAARGQNAVSRPRPAPPRPVTLRWPRARDASYYYVQLVRGRTRILDLWPTRPAVTLPRSWRYGDLPYRLDPGRYRWYTYPGYGNPDELRLGPLLGRGIVVVRTRR
jgi:hypothetical protein